jgi:hypothetical protein
MKCITKLNSKQEFHAAHKSGWRLLLAATAVAVGAWAAPARAFDGCRVILCLAGPWRSIPECVPDVREALRCMARGKCWPTCASAPGVSMSWASSAACPPQYGIYETDACGRQTLVGCSKTGVIDVAFNGVPSWVRVWFNQGAADNSAVLEYSDAARAAYPSSYLNPQFDMDYALWVASQPTTPPNYCTDGGG